MSNLVILKTVKVGLESLDSADEMRMVRGWQVFAKSTNLY